MVVLEALKCARCGEQWKRALINGKYSEKYTCAWCASLVCGTCTQGGLHCPHHNYANYATDPKFLSKICTFALYGPEAELCLIDLQIASNASCSKCNCTTGTLCRRDIQQVLCSKCYSSECSWETSSVLETALRKIICELIERAMPKTRIQRAGASGIVLVKIVANCTTCKKELGTPPSCSFRPIIFDGELYCYNCADKVHQYFPVSRRCYCLSRLIDFIQCIPENQLHLLTYSKWVKAVDCKQHQDVLYELNAVSSDGSTTGKLRSFFKKEEICHKFKSARSEMSTEASLSTTLDPAIADSLFPARIVCTCGREEELPNIFDCSTCSTYGVCPLCLANNHWRHDVTRSLKTLTLCLLNSRSEDTEQKLIKLSDQAMEVNKKSEKVFEKLCCVLGVAFKEAAMQSGDLQRFQYLLAKANISEIEKHFNKITEGTVKLHKMIDSLCEELMDAVGEETPSANTYVQAVSPADMVEEKSE